MIRSGTHLDRAFVLNLRAQEVYRPWQGRDSAVTSALLRVLSSAHQGVLTSVPQDLLVLFSRGHDLRERRDSPSDLLGCLSVTLVVSHVIRTSCALDVPVGSLTLKRQGSH
ncbi:MAG: hypothetical protein JWL97_4371 [Gemmatimonadales bacterium]|nr:hypothetical protein [Gemmatimonadales bacterium]